MTIRSIPVFHAVRFMAARGNGWLVPLHRVLQAIETRRQLAEMDRRMLADIGISRSEALEEARRAPWDLAPRRR
ncbi:DUF1127 domain-containing protein [Roseomonas fluvialis]|uniref:YjiS-like domain-containing protein n=1 Tax=Roseomonas fluvialis TaxID=1750527 RepID=A0ABN6P083_9PROT|nr:DUF1127 domain-containing protein [Roseomonas fluvialis]BDG71217.1 hypothetical protein Rmf_11460 [Roseomonas fluvialis]